MLNPTDNNLSPTDTVAVKDSPTAQVPVIDTGYYGIVAHVREKFLSAKVPRKSHEDRWMRAYRNVRGIYDPSMQFREFEKSRVFVKITKTKVLAAYGQILEVLFSTGNFPLGIEPTPVPEGVAEYAHIPPADQAQQQPPQPQDPYGYAGDGKDVQPGATFADMLGGLDAKYKGAGFVPGPAPDKTKSPQISPAKITAANMQKVILDQLADTNATQELCKTLFEMVMLGTGCLKGPFTAQKLVNRWVVNAKEDPSQPGIGDEKQSDEETVLEGRHTYMPSIKYVPKLKHTTIWNIYPDPNAIIGSSMEYIIERMALTPSDMRKLIKQPFFREEAVRGALMTGPNYNREWFETFLDENNAQNLTNNRYEVLEYWGVLDSDLIAASQFPLKALGLSELDVMDEVPVNIWVCGTHLLRMVINPFKPQRIPYILACYENNPYHIFGIGVPENMEDAQMVMNGHARMAIDNLALAGHVVFDVDENALVDGQDMKIYPGKIFRRAAGASPGAAVFAIKFPDTSQSNLAMFDKFRQLSDESTGIPSYSHGQTGVSTTTRTAAGMSMLMGAAALNIKTVVKNIDEGLLRPIGEGMFSWNMQFNSDTPEIHGDFDVVAKGTSSLMAKEIKSQRLINFLQIASNPVLAPFVKFNKIISEIATSMDLDTDEIINSPEEAAIQAKIIGTMNGGQGQASPSMAGTPAGMGSQPGVPDGTAQVDSSGAGGGNIGTGNVPTPGEAGFTGQAPAA